MKKLLFLILSISTLFNAVQARPVRALLKGIGAVTTIGAGVYAYKHREELQDKAIKTGLNLMQNYAPEAKKDTYATRVFNTLKKYKPNLLPSMRDYYENRFAHHIENMQKISPEESASLHEFTEVTALDTTKLSLEKVVYLVNNDPEAHTLFVNNAIKKIKELNNKIFRPLIWLDERDTCFKNMPTLIEAIKNNFKDIDPEILNEVMQKFSDDEAFKDSFTKLTCENPGKRYTDDYFIRLFTNHAIYFD